MSNFAEADDRPSQSDFGSLDFGEDVASLTAAANSVLSFHEHQDETGNSHTASPESGDRAAHRSARSGHYITAQPPRVRSRENLLLHTNAGSSLMEASDGHTSDPSKHSCTGLSSRDDLCEFYEDRRPSCGSNEEGVAENFEHPLDISWLSDRCDGDVHLLVAVLETFCEQGKTHCSSMEDALAENDLQKLCFHTDFIVGSARNVGARQLEQRAESLANCLRACIEHGVTAQKDKNLQKQVRDVTLCFQEVSTFWQIGVQSVQGGSVHPLEQVDNSIDSNRGYVWPTNLPQNFKISMVQLQDYLRSVKDDAHSDNISNRSLEDDEDEATEPNRGIEVDQVSRASSDIPCVADKCDVESEANLVAVFQHVRTRLERMRRSNGLGQVQSVKEEAKAICKIASACGCRGIAGKAEGIASSSAQYVLSGVLDELELQVDSAEAIWKSSGWII